MSKTAVLSLLISLTTLTPTFVLARGGGGCIEQGTRIRTPTGYANIENLRAGDKVHALVGDHLEVAEVQSREEVRPEEFIELILASRKLNLRVTAEHPIQTERGVFRAAGELKNGESVQVWSQGSLRPFTIQSSARVKAVRLAYNLLVSPGGTYVANSVIVHNKGCFLPDTPILRADGTTASIQDIRTGDALLAFKTDGQVVTTKVQNVVTRDVDSYAEVKTEKIALRVTMEHPFYVGAGTFKTLEALRVGDSVFAFDGKGLSAQSIISIEEVRKRTRVYNLRTDAPHTYFASGIAVHNKGGGGGCFPAGTLILTSHGQIAIEQLRTEEMVSAIGGDGVRTEARIEGIHETTAAIFVVETDAGTLRTTAEHPVRLADGSFRRVGELVLGDQITMRSDGHLQHVSVMELSRMGSVEPVFNLTVSAPHTFVANRFVVHNKGGGGFSGRSYGSRGSGGGGDLPGWAIFLIFGVVIMIFVVAATQKRDENLDYVHPRSAVEPKAAKTRKLLEFIAKVDPAFATESLRQVAESTFRKLQECWESRHFDPMRPLMMPDLYEEHWSQIRSLIRNHEINKIADLSVDRIDIVNARYTHTENEREFTALITATARDYYVDDRTRSTLRGDDEPAQFQEFWTFQRLGGQWLLREIEQTRESDALKDENFFEQFTDTGLKQVYADAASEGGPAGPWLEKSTETKANRTERLLNFLAQTDKLWDRQGMLERARKVFTRVHMAREAGELPALTVGDLFPEVVASLQQTIHGHRTQGITTEYRNFCVRKVELILVRNFADNTKDEFVTRISAHAQQIIKQQGQVIREDEYVSPFMEFWTFGRRDGAWKLKEVLLPARGESLVDQENTDQDSSKPQLEWYYRQTRAV